MPQSLAVSVVIPTFNGVSLLKENLHTVINDLSQGDELLIVDDASSDSTKRYLCNKFHLTIDAKGADNKGEYEIFSGAVQGLEIKLIVNQENLRFAQSCNRAVEETKNPLVFLINNDVALTKNVSSRLRKEFENDQNLFAVGCLEEEPNLEGVWGGKNKLWFEKGLYHHSRADNFKTGSTAWASGGSAIFSKEKWLELEGFDDHYYPAYWEDIDLSMRAKKKGWKVMFLHTAKVIHNHESTNKSAFDQNELKKISWKHADYFSWKHGNLKQKTQFLLYKPYWIWQRLRQESNKSYFYATVAILLIAFILRFYRLADVPAGMTWDEAAIGYNGYAVVHTRHDEWLERLPISFRSFGDYKAPFAIYLVGVITSIFGLNLFVLRLPFAFSGVLAVLGMIKLTKLLLKAHTKMLVEKENLSAESLSLLSGFLMAITPWHIHFSRVGFESGLALTFILWGFYYLALFVNGKKYLKSMLSFFQIAVAVTLFACSMYTYHSSKFFIPIIGLVFLVSHHKLLRKKIWEVTVGGVLFMMMLAPMLYDSIFGGGLTRSDTLVFSKADSSLKVIELIFNSFIAHLSPTFLSGGWTDTLRHGTSAHGVFLEIVFALIIVGVLKIPFDIIKRKSSVNWLRLSAGWILVALIPAAIGDHYPQANRALLALPGFIWMAIVGIQFFNKILQKLSKKNGLVLKLAQVLFILILLCNLGVYLKHYYTVFAYQSADAFNEGYIPVMKLVHQYELGINGYPEVDQILFSNKYSQPYIFALFVRKTNPIWYQGGSLIKYKFVDEVKPSDLVQPNSLIVATKYDSLFNTKPDHEIVSQGQEIRFRVYYTGSSD